MPYDQIQFPVFVGAAQWMALHTYAARYTPTKEKRKAAKDYVNSMIVLFDCEKCQNHFRYFMNVNNIDLYLDSPDRFFLWTYMAHDGATKAKGDVSPPYNETKRYYFESLHGSCESCA